MGGGGVGRGGGGRVEGGGDGVGWVDPVWVWGWSSSKETKPYQIICSI